jgi:phosphate:Na+ symporter
MEYTLFDFLSLVGSLGFFLFGMKYMSEALQKVAGEKMRGFLEAMTSNRFKGILTGFLITSIIQSSSATTVMVVSFVNAGLISLTQSIGVIMGANIGTTVTAWLISLLGFKVDVSLFALPIIGIAIPLIFSKNPKRIVWGEFIIGFSILFMGLGFLKDSVPNINDNPEVLKFIAKYSSYHFLSVLIFLFSGTLLTIIIQSSSAVMALTLVMCFNGWISFDMAAAMVLGENIGTTITANLAAIVVNDTAKRSARAHFLFNVTGVVILLFFFNPFLRLIEWMLISFGQVSPFETPGGDIDALHGILPIALSIFHSTFNILNTLVQVWFIPYIVKAVTFMVKPKDDDDEVFKLKFINTGLVSVNEISLFQAKNEILVFIGRTKKMFNLTKELFTEVKPQKAEKLIEKIRKFEEIADRIDEEVTTFITKISYNEPSKNISENSNLMLRLVSRIESANDSCSIMAELIFEKKSKNLIYTEEMEQRLFQMFDMVDVLLFDFNVSLNQKKASIDVELERNRRDHIQQYVEKLDLLHLKDIKKGVYKYKVGINYCDIYSECSVLADHIYHSLKYINELKI